MVGKKNRVSSKATRDSSAYKVKYGNESVPPEQVKLGEKYTFTLNISESDLIGLFPDQYDKYLKKLKILINDGLLIKGAFEYSKFGKLHFHGELIFKTPLAVALFYMKLAKLKCHYSLDTTEKDYDLGKYAHKGEWYMKPLCDKYSKQYIIDNSVILDHMMGRIVDDDSEQVSFD